MHFLTWLTATLCAAHVSWQVSALEAGEYEIVAHLKQRNLQRLEQLFWEVSDPDSDSYLQHFGVDRVASVIGASTDEILDVRKWLIGLGADPSSVRVSALKDTVTAKFKARTQTTNVLLQSATGRPKAVEFLVRRDPLHSSLGAVVDKPRRTIDAGERYTISNIKGAYGMPSSLKSSNETTLQMVWGPGTFGYSKSELLSHKYSQCPLLDMSRIEFDTPNHGTPGGDNYGEGNLDVKMIASFGLGVKTLVSNTNTSASTEEGDGFGQALLDFVTELSSRQSVPHVLSMSLGSLSAASCDLLCSEVTKVSGYTLKDCKAYMQKQRQVCMFLSQAQQARINTAFQVLGLRGVSIFGSSGDGGSHFSFGKFEGGRMAQILNEISCKYQMPVFPTASPYIVSVGGTMWAGSSQHPVTWSGFGGGSGGGFSWEFSMPQHQKAAVTAYLSNVEGLPPASSFNRSGRAYPDISAVAVEGTSQSCPIIAGMFSMIIDARLRAGLPPLGFVAPRIYGMAGQHPGEIFEDVSEGNTKTSCDNGFPSRSHGWDPNTGWGRPVWSGMMQHLASDATLPGSKVASSAAVVV